MKAYILGIKGDPDQGNHIVWDTTVRNAKKRINESDLYYDSWIDVEAHRYPAFDDMEHYTQKQLFLEMWKNCWWFDSDEPTFDPEIHTDEDFYKWYDKRYGEEK